MPQTVQRHVPGPRRLAGLLADHGGPSMPLELTLAVLADAAHEAGVQLIVVTDHSGDPPILHPQAPDSLA
ncbi:hypothetical protein ACWD4J_41770 [Streptomyces sp. NPDC002577]